MTMLRDFVAKWAKYLNPYKVNICQKANLTGHRDFSNMVNSDLSRRYFFAISLRYFGASLRYFARIVTISGRSSLEAFVV